MEKVYVFKAALKHRKGLWRRIEIKGSQTLGDFDDIMREAFDHDTFDHLSEFFSGKAWRSEGFGEIYPDGGGSGARKKIHQRGLSEGDTIEYIYDFGDNIQHVIKLEKIVEPEKGVEYPRIIARNKPRYHYCELCKEQGKKTIATWFCIECAEKEARDVIICEDCLEKEHEDHYADEMIY